MAAFSTRSLMAKPERDQPGTDPPRRVAPTMRRGWQVTNPHRTEHNFDEQLLIATKPPEAEKFWRETSSVPLPHLELVLENLFSSCPCGFGHLKRIQRQLWMRLFPSRRLYRCAQCGRLQLAPRSAVEQAIAMRLVQEATHRRPREANLATAFGRARET
jgi:hypothetical protein